MSQYVTIPAAGTGTKSTGTGTTTVNYYVSTTGNDSTGDGSLNRPWATPGKAQAVIRASGINTAANRVVVNILAGTYYNTALALIPSDSNVTYRCPDGTGLVRLIGGTKITPASWVQHSGSIFKTPVAGPVYTIFENGVRARAARLPKLNPGASFPCAFAPYFHTAGVLDSYTTLQYNPVDFDPSVWTLADIRLFVWSCILSQESDWFTDVHGASALNTGTQQFSLNDGGMKFTAQSGTFPARYTVQGPLQLLTEAGEFVVTGGFLYYWPRTAPITAQEIVIPSTKQVVSMIGTSPTSRVTGVSLENLGIEVSDFNDWYRFGAVNNTLGAPPADYPYQAQLSLARNGLVYLENTDNIRINGCHLKNSGFAGVYIREYGQSIDVADSFIEHVGTTGIYGEGRAPAAGDIFKNNGYRNLRIWNFGELAGDGVAIRLNQSNNNNIIHVDAANGPRQAIVLTGWDGVLSNSDMYSYANSISYSKIQKVGQDSGDMGAITIEFHNNTGVNSLNQITIDSVTAHSSVLDTSPNGMFCDNQTNGQLLSNMQVTNTQGNQFRTNASSGHVLTNTSFQSDGTSNPSFNAGLMDTAHIGTTSGFPF